MAATILVPLDGTAHATTALPVASTLAALEGATIHLVQLTGRVLPPAERLEALGLGPDQLRDAVFDQIEGEPAKGITRLARERGSAFIVLCTHTAGTVRGTLGHVAKAVLRTAPCPVVLVQPERGLGPWRLRRLLLPHDGTPASAAAMDPAADLAHRAGAELIVLHVAGATVPSSEPGTLTAPRYLDQPQHEWPAWTQEFLERMRVLGHPPAEVRLRLVVASGAPGTEIVRFAREHETDLVVLAWHGRWAPARAATLRAILRGSKCPTLVVRADSGGS